MKLLLFLLCLFFVPNGVMQTNAPSNTDLVNLIKDCRTNGKNDLLMGEYTYTWKVTQRGTDSKGKFKDEFAMYETYAPTLKHKGVTKLVLIQTHEKSQPLPADKVEKEQQKAGERLLKADTENQQANAKDPSLDKVEDRKHLPGIYFDTTVNYGVMKNVKLSLQTILTECVFENPRDEMLNGRPAIKLNFRPPASDVFAKDEKFLAQVQGTVWIDKADRIVVKVEGRKLNPDPKDDNPVFLYQSIRVPEGKWLPERAQFNGNKNKALFNGMGGDMIFEWLDYKRFVTNAEDAKIKSPK